MSLLRSLVISTPSIAKLPARSILSVAGSQAPEFLNGVLASAIPKVPHRPFFAAILNAQGRVLYDLLIYTEASTDGRPKYLIEYDSRASDGPSLHDLLKRYVLRAKVKIRDVSAEYDVWAAWGSKETSSPGSSIPQWMFASSGAIEPVWANASEQWPWGSEDRMIRDRRAPGMGCRVLVGKNDRPSLASTHVEVNSDLYKLHRIVHGVPEGVDDIYPQTAFPMESNLDVMGALDFRKGCYVGQELTVRTYHTGVVRKRIVPVFIHDSPKLPSSASLLDRQSLSPGLDIHPVVITDRPKPRGSGRLLSSTHGVGLALLRTDWVGDVERSNISLELRDGSKKLFATPSWPNWWPVNLSSGTE
ncbi:Aminomethyltransferase folate-binding domain-containing protein [Dendrothele bispora CBS 962.96]|uniref:Aminomethyltransferase folate-binding domain-containing protein n=1 Tax=Dendrothele bispora (strain CBS 962.96) TaxID=1314807 RepID=A0A4S8MZ70_DENBC|nr:Aminomethyltransferase folate-binding domain-containing protein [Dendrothele bispora CBS 962.96]